MTVTSAEFSSFSKVCSAVGNVSQPANSVLTSNRGNKVKVWINLDNNIQL